MGVCRHLRHVVASHSAFLTGALPMALLPLCFSLSFDLSLPPSRTAQTTAAVTWRPHVSPHYPLTAFAHHCYQHPQLTRHDATKVEALKGHKDIQASFLSPTPLGQPPTITFSASSLPFASRSCVFHLAVFARSLSPSPKAKRAHLCEPPKCMRRAVGDCLFQRLLFAPTLVNLRSALHLSFFFPLCCFPFFPRRFSTDPVLGNRRSDRQARKERRRQSLQGVGATVEESTLPLLFASLTSVFLFESVWMTAQAFGVDRN